MPRSFNEFLISISRRTIFRILKKNEFNYKRSQAHVWTYNDPDFQIKKDKLASKIKAIGNDFESIDETSLELFSSPDYGWTKGNDKCHVKNKTRIRVSLAVAINRKKVTAWKVTDGSFNGEKFQSFICNEVIIRSKKRPLFMDNARIHTSNTFKKYIRARGLRILELFAS